MRAHRRLWPSIPLIALFVAQPAIGFSYPLSPLPVTIVVDTPDEQNVQATFDLSQLR